mmetsp:Transcript_48986/g.106667  ORF Transcript_48986/g.106667 Transcript_48986/m.106667 type:complete len:381 (+) Transcript_48986:144-1286(+)|eukprot:CAMPEP_0204262408 /NCGR_PEP_ID=MMETSP0468-20130131/7657_1 /ASSEMBLY_ACC=CAM_ASM_000383 /TAXON_ID=2969 /ORGANISM="Oxyrrhis marina" /LENGTH=380 /DNA_ID=CAMNT_0051237075 /DNA_START=93 /DNA_END=1235 /DNA_ORIENTATION=+
MRQGSRRMAVPQLLCLALSACLVEGRLLRSNVTTAATTGVNSSMTLVSSLFNEEAGNWAPPPGKTMQQLQCDITEMYLAKPTRCPQGGDMISMADLRAAVPEFVAMYAEMGKTFPAQCCMGINHLFAVWYTARVLKPAAIIESGVAAGHTTWMLRKVVGPSVPIFSLDPGDPAINYPGPGITGWRDPSGMTTYMTAGYFKDFASVNWASVIPDAGMRSRTFVLLDDHQSSIARAQVAKSWGFKNVFYEDNYPLRVATSGDDISCHHSTVTRDYAGIPGDAYSPQAMCGGEYPRTEYLLYKDKFGSECQYITRSHHESNTQFFSALMESYFEFPALFSPCNTKRETILSKDVAQLTAMGLPPPDWELWHYGHLHPALFTLK